MARVWARSGIDMRILEYLYDYKSLRGTTLAKICTPENYQKTYERLNAMVKLGKLESKNYMEQCGRVGRSRTSDSIALGVDAEGMTTAKKLYTFLELHPAVYSRWLKKNIKENIFAELNQDYFPLNTNVEREISAFEAKQQNTDYKLTASFAKKLAMSSQTPGELAREYFIRVEQNAIQNFTDI